MAPSRIGLAVNLPYLCRSADPVHPNDNTEPVLSLAVDEPQGRKLASEPDDAATFVRQPFRPAPARRKPFYQPKYTEKTNGESTPPAITSFSPARSGASSVRK